MPGKTVSSMCYVLVGAMTEAQAEPEELWRLESKAVSCGGGAIGASFSAVRGDLGLDRLG